MVYLALVSGLVSFIVFLGHEVFSRPVTGMLFLSKEISNLPETQIVIYRLITTFSSCLSVEIRPAILSDGVEFIELHCQNNNMHN